MNSRQKAGWSLLFMTIVIFALTIMTSDAKTPVIVHPVLVTQAIGGTITPKGTVTVRDGKDKLFTIIPKTGYHVVSIITDAGDVTSSATKTGRNYKYILRNVLADTHTVTATFAKNTFLLTVNILGTGGASGTIEAASGTLTLSGTSYTGSYDYGTAVTLKGTPDSNSALKGWSGCKAANTECTVTVNKKTTVTVRFKPGVKTDSNKVTISGKMDNSSVTMASSSKSSSLASRAKKADSADSPLEVDNIIAVSPDGTLVQAVRSGSSFSLSLDKGKPYVLALLNGATIQALYKTDEATDMDAFPINSKSGNIDLGTLSISTGGIASGTISSTSLISGLGVSVDTATAFGAMGKGLARFANIDIDGNNVIDKQEGKYYNLKIGFDFLSSNFSSITGAWSNKDDVGFWFYGFNYLSCPEDTSLDWAKATIHSPQDFTICNAGTCDPSSTVYNVNDDTAGTADVISGNSTSCRHMNFYGGSRAIISPMPPPAGTYTVKIPVSGGTLNQELTFRYLATPDMTNMQNIYVPEIKLTKENNRITLIEWQWWRKAGTSWVQPSDEELALVMDWASFVIGQTQWAGDPVTARVSGSMSIARSGSVVPPAHSFEPGVIMINVGDKSQYDYSFEFR